MTVRSRLARLGLGAYLALAFSLLSIALTLILTVVAERNAGEQVRTSIGRNLAELAHQTANRMDRAIFERYREVELVAGRMAGKRDLALVQRELDALQASYSYYAWIGLTDTAGRVQASTGGLLKGADVSQQPWFSRALAGQHLGDVHAASLLEKLLGNPADEPMRFVDIAFPVPGPQGQQAGVLGAHLSWRWARDLRETIVATLDAGRNVELLVLRAEGTVLLGPPALEGVRLQLPSVAAASAGGSGFRIERWPDGRDYVVGFVQSKGYLRSPGLGWTVLVRQGLAEADAPVIELQRRLLAWGIGMALLFTVLGWLAARAISRPLLQLVRTAQQLQAGQPALPLAPDSYREVQTLGASLNSLVASLQRKEADLRALNVSLELRVEVRTAELRYAFERVQESEERVHTIIESAQDSFVGMDFDGRITDWNSQAERMFGWTREEVLGQPFAETLLAQRHAGATRAALQHFLAEGDAPFIGRTMERVMVARDGREIPVEVKIGRVDTGKLRLFSVFVQDISRRKEIERLKNEFISTVSHELRTPMTAIYASLNLLESGMAGELPADVQRLIDISSKSCERLIRLINDVLDVEKIQSGLMQYDMHPQPLRLLVEQAIRDTGAFAAGLGVRIDFVAEAEADPMVLADADRIVQVAVNLLSNAATFSPPAGTVDVRLRVVEGVARVSVTDRGAGVPEGFRQRVFERFAQADGSDRRQKGGTGLGLNICRSIVQAHRGRIDFSSEPGRTEFFFELPPV
jgi:PAS domain S-box-containing protein